MKRGPFLRYCAWLAARARRSSRAYAHATAVLRTKTVDKTLDPEWRETCVIVGAPARDAAVFTVCDKDVGSSLGLTTDDFLGQCVLPLGPVIAAADRARAARLGAAPPRGARRRPAGRPTGRAAARRRARR